MMSPQVVLNEELKSIEQWISAGDGFGIDTMELWLEQGLYPLEMRAKVEARIKELRFESAAAAAVRMARFKAVISEPAPGEKGTIPTETLSAPSIAMTDPKVIAVLESIAAGEGR